MKKIRYIILMLVVVCVSIVPIKAQEKYVNDEGNYFLASYVEILNEMTQVFHDKYNLNAVVITTNNMEKDFNLSEYANQYYQEYYGDSDGIIFAFNKIEERDVSTYINTFGDASKYLDPSLDLNSLFIITNRDRFVYSIQFILYQMAQLMDESVKSRNVVDMANLLSIDKEKELSDKISKTIEDSGLDITILTTYSKNDKSITAFADDFYDDNGYGISSNKDGLILVLFINKAFYSTNEWYLSTSGKAIDIFTDWGIEYVGSTIKPELRDKNYFGGMNSFLDLIPKFIDKYEHGSPYDRKDYDGLPIIEELMAQEEVKEFSLNIKNLLISMAISFIIAILVSGIRFSKLKSKRTVTHADEYVKENSLKLTKSEDLYLYQTVTKTYIPKDDDNDSSSGSSSSSMSSSGSSTHQSSSGSTHGGGGGSF